MLLHLEKKEIMKSKVSVMLIGRETSKVGNQRWGYYLLLEVLRSFGNQNYKV